MFPPSVECQHSRDFRKTGLYATRPRRWKAYPTAKERKYRERRDSLTAAVTCHFCQDFRHQGAGAPFHCALSKWRIREYSSIITKLCAKNHTNVLCRRESSNYRLSPRSDSVQPLGHGRVHDGQYTNSPNLDEREWPTPISWVRL